MVRLLRDKVSWSHYAFFEMVWGLQAIQAACDTETQGDHPESPFASIAWFVNASVTWTLSFLLALTLAWAPKLRAASSALKIPGGGQLLVNAKNATRDYDKGILELEGNVQVFYKQQYISCDRAIVNEKTNIVETWGNLVISSPQTYVEGDHAVLNYKDNTGLIDHGFVKSGQVIFEGRVVRKLGPNTYDADDSSFTACTTCPTAWSFTGTRMHAEVGGYAFIKYPIMRVANVPVLWLPYLIIPLKSERQTGLLIPSIEYTDNRLVVGPKFFWAINRSQDILFTLKYYPVRGLKLLGEYNYMLSNDSAGTLSFGLMHDQLYAQDPVFSSNATTPRSTRWFLSYDHKYQLPYGFSQKTLLNLASDIWYPKDFSLEMGGRGDPALENRVSLTRNTEATHASAEIDYSINMLKTVPTASNQDTVQRWPELRYSYAERPLFASRLLAGFDVNYVNFAREGLGFDDVSFNNGKFIDTKRTDSFPASPPPYGNSYSGGVFDPQTDIVRAGQRLDIKPEVSYPFAIGSYIDLIPSALFRYTQYVFNASSPSVPYDATPSRSYAQGRLSARTRFFRIYSGEDGAGRSDTSTTERRTGWFDSESRIEGGKRETDVNAPPRVSAYRHEIMPELVATYLPFLTQPANHPFFAQGGQVPIWLGDVPIDTTNFSKDPTNIQFDYYDRLTTRTTVGAYLNNRLVRKRWVRGAPEYKQIASWRIGQTYDFEEANRNDPPRLPFGDIQSIMDLHFDRLDLNSTLSYFPYHRVTNSTSYVRFKSLDERQFVQLDFSQSFKINRFVEQTLANPDGLTASTGVKTRYLDVATALNYAPRGYAPIDFPLNSWSTDLNIKPPGNCWGIRFHFEQLFNGPTIFKVDFDYNFGGTG